MFCFYYIVLVCLIYFVKIPALSLYIYILLCVRDLLINIICRMCDVLCIYIYIYILYIYIYVGNTYLFDIFCIDMSSYVYIYIYHIYMYLICISYV